MRSSWFSIVAAAVCSASCGAPASSSQPNAPAVPAAGSATTATGSATAAGSATTGSAAALPASQTLAQAISYLDLARAEHRDADATGALAIAISDARAQLAERDAPITYTLPEDTDADAARPPIVSPDGSRWATVQSQRVSIHDAVSGLEIGVIRASIDGAVVAMASNTRIVIADAHDVRTVDDHYAARVVRPIGGANIVAGPGGQIAIVDDKSIEIVAGDTANTRVAQATRPGGGQPATWLAWHGSTLVVFDGKRAESWRATGSELALATTLADPIDRLALSWDGHRIATAKDGALRVFDPSGVERVHAAMPESYDTAQQLGFVGSAVVVERSYGDALLLAGDKLQPLPGVQLPRDAWTQLPDRVTCGGNGDIVATGASLAVVRVAPRVSRVSGLAWTPRGDKLVAMTGDHVAIISATGVVSVPSSSSSYVERARFRPVPGAGDPHELWWLEISPPGMYGGYYASYDASGSLAVLDLAAPVLEVKRPSGSTLLDFSRDGARVLVKEAADKPIEIRDAATSKRLQTVQIRDPFDLSNPMPNDRGAFAANDKLVVVGGNGHTVAWDIARDKAVWSKDEPFVAVSPDSRFVITHPATGLRVTDIANGGEVTQLALPLGESATATEPARDVVAMAFSPDGKLAAIGTRGGALQIVDVGTWKLHAGWTVAATEVVSVAWRGDGKMIATGSRGGAITLSDVAQRRVATIEIGGTIAATADRPESVSWLAWFDDGSTLGPGAELAALWVGGRVPIGFVGGAGEAPKTAAGWPAGTFLP
jgi:WD40 repeat protein|nr:WD40 repeat domain-containing protein [Kofleriaceae bacterium]